jgi:adenylate kinase
MKHLPINIILLGDPAAGKATQAVRIVRRYGVHDFDMGKELRRIQHDPHVRRRYGLVGEALSHGALAPTGFVRRILEKKLGAIPRSRGILFDGHPKMLGEAQLLSRLLRREERLDPLVIYLTVPVATTISRMSRRKRPDDTLQAFRNRQRYYLRNIRAAVAFYRSRYVYHKVSGAGSREQVFRRISKILDRFVAFRSKKKP